ncbi:hypothetical protein F3087_18850 [Nocardia colli]|uniref:Uncharacterized protein n=1 Tax=Nocardia colli TaxID=2545717 RepID=A0A5N0EE61_9NOCA|nr:hypothetical protein [Nocardia colli]KAA8887708.1 hypothetical protein F3087_18850 [Nocardia colli]
MELDTETYCRGCGAPLAWRLTRTTARLLPLDVEPNEHGRVRVDSDNSATVLSGGELLLTRVQGVPLYVHHVAGVGCPDVWPADAGRVALARLADEPNTVIASQARAAAGSLAGRPADTKAPTSLFPAGAAAPGVGTHTPKG